MREECRKGEKEQRETRKSKELRERY